MLFVHGRLDEARVRALVLLLRGCLVDLPPKFRSALQLRSGVGEKRPLSAGAVAVRLRISTSHLLTLELAALRRLQGAARTTGCAAEPQAAVSAVVMSAFAPAEGRRRAAFGLESLREEKSPGETVVPGTAGKQSPPSAAASSLLGIHPGSSGFWTLAGVLLAVIALGTIVLDNLGIGPRHRYRGGPRRK